RAAAPRMAGAVRIVRSAQAGACGFRLHRGDDRPFRRGRASPADRGAIVDDMSFYSDIHARVIRAIDALSEAGGIARGLDLSRVAGEPPRDPAHGDVSTNAAMILARPAGQNPRALAEALVAQLAGDPDLAEVSVAGPGFINMRLRPG